MFERSIRSREGMEQGVWFVRLSCCGCLLLLLLGGCKKGGGKLDADIFHLLYPFQLTRNTHQLLEKLALQKDVLQKGLRVQLEKSRWFRVSKDTSRLEGRYGVQIASRLRTTKLKFSKDGRRLEFRLYAQMGFQLTPLKGERDALMFSEEEGKTYRFVKPLKVGSSRLWAGALLQKEGRRLFERVWKKGGELLLLYGEMRKEGSGRLLSLVEKGSVSQRVFAIRLLGKRRYKPAVMAIARSLRSKERRILHAAIFALVKLKDRRGVLPLIELARGKKPIFLVQLITALAELGGRQAESYLFTLSGAHPAAQIRAAAKSALQELKESRKAAQRELPPGRRPASRGSSSSG